MRTGTPLDLTPFGSVLQGIGILYWLVVLAVVGIVLWKVQGWLGKLILSAIVLTVMVGPVAWYVMRKHEQQQQAKSRLEAAMAHFEMRCKSAGEKITRTVGNVEGVVWMKWRPVGLNGSQFAMHDPYGKDCSGEECIKRLLRVTKGAELNPVDAKKHSVGYLFVETIDPEDGRHYRYVGVMKLGPGWTPEAVERHKKVHGEDPPNYSYLFGLERKHIDKFTARYGVTWEDISTREDREQWIAGGALRVIDLQTNEVISERIGYLIDTGQGNTAGFRDPWGWAKSYAPRCPRVDERTWEFSTRVLQPKKQGE